MHSDKQLTKGGNQRAPPMTLYLDWVVDAWEGLSRELIEKSFKSCGITNALDGSEDDLIHVFKPDGELPNRLQALKDARANRQTDDLAEQINQIDLNQDEENGYVDNEPLKIDVIGQ